jgi:hypothetical protein
VFRIEYFSYNESVDNLQRYIGPVMEDIRKGGGLARNKDERFWEGRKF